MAIPNQTAAVVTGTTAGGTPYTQWTVTPPASNDVALVLAPTSRPEGSTLNAVVSFHGSGGSQNTINGTNTNTVRDALLDAGYLILSPNLHGNSWSNEQSMTDVAALVGWARNIWSVPRLFIFAQSMGGGIGALALARQVVTPVVAAAFLAPAVSLSTAYAKGGLTATDINTAYSLASDGSDYAAKTAGHDALARPASDYAGRWIRVYASASDATTNKAANADAFQAKVSPVAGVFEAVTVTGAHLSADHYKPAQIVDFYARALAAVTTPTSTVSVWTGAAWAPAPVLSRTGTAWVDAPVRVF